MTCKPMPRVQPQKNSQTNSQKKIMSDEEIAIIEESGRRTRSGRAPKKAVVLPAARSTRRSVRKTQEQHIDADEQEFETQESDLKNIEIEASNSNQNEETSTQQVLDQLQDLIVPAQANDQQDSSTIQEQKDDNSLNFTFGDFQTDTMTQLDEQSSEKEDTSNHIQNSTDSVDNMFFANLAAEENANSFPSGVDESESNDQIVEQENGDMIEEEEFEEANEMIAPPENSINNNDDVNTEEVNSENAIAEDIGIPDTQETMADVDAEMVSEDELPAPVQPQVQDAEEVSDDELPGPKLAELPADTEIVSEDELPAGKKDATKRKVDEGYDPGSPTEELEEIPEKKTKTDSDAEKEETEKKKKEEKKVLPDLDKYWKAVNEDTSDFTAWTYLLQYVDQENDIEAAREAYDAFLAHYPYCYGYWRKFADFEKRKGNKKKCEEVFERGLKAIPLSVDLWIHFLIHCKTNNGDDEKHIRTQFERAINSCGMEFRSDKLWESYIKWETDNNRLQNVLAIYDRLLATPTQGYSNHFDNFQELVNSNTVQAVLSVEEFKKLREIVRSSKKSVPAPTSTQHVPASATETTNDGSDTPVAMEQETSASEEIASVIEEEEEKEADDHVENEEEAAAIKEKLIAIRRKLHKLTVSNVTTRWQYEEGIKRPYFHVKPLERCQLKNWKEYLDFETEQGDQARILVLFERCLIACALYDEFWLKLIRYLDSIALTASNSEEILLKTRDTYERACTIHHPDKPSLHLMWSAFEESQNNYSKASEILQNLEKINTTIMLQISYRRINLERRRGDISKCIQLYEHYIQQSQSYKNKSTLTSLGIKYARFLNKIKKDWAAGWEVLKSIFDKDQTNVRIALQMIDLALQKDVVDEEEVVKIMDSFILRDSIEPDQRVLFAQRKVEFLEDFGSTALGLQEAQRTLQLALNKANDAKKKAAAVEAAKKASKETNTSNASVTAASSSSTYSGSYSYGNTSSTNQYYGSSSAQTASGYQSYGDTTNYGYNQQWGQYSQTAAYGSYPATQQWSGYGNYNY